MLNISMKSVFRSKFNLSTKMVIKTKTYGNKSRTVSNLIPEDDGNIANIVALVTLLAVYLL